MRRMSAFWLAVVVAGCGIPAGLDGFGSASMVPGAVWTTNSTGGSVNENTFAAKEDVYLNGGPPQGGAGLDDGTYVVGVTDANGDTLLSPLPLKQVQVVNGDFMELVQLAPFADSANGVYKAWATKASDYPSDAMGAKGSGFHPSKSKTDTFRVTGTGTPGPTPTPTGTGTPGPTPTPTSTATPTPTPGPSPTPTPGGGGGGGGGDVDPNPCPDGFGAIYGDVYGDIYGDIWGDVYGDIYGDHYGNLHGDVLGDLYGDHYGEIFGDVYGDQYGDQYGNVHGRRFGDMYGDIYGMTGGGC